MKRKQRIHREIIRPDFGSFCGVSVVPDTAATDSWKTSVERILHRVPAGELHFPIACATLLSILWLAHEQPVELSYAALGTLGFMMMVVAWMRRKRDVQEAKADSSAH